MTVFGKILVFLNLVFSVITGALIVFVFTTRANWVAAYNDAKVKAEAAEAAYKTEKLSHENDVKQCEATEASLTAERDALRGDLAREQARAQQLERSAQTQTALTNTSATELQKNQAELNQIKSEREALVAEKESLRTRIVAMQQEIDRWRGTAVNADLEAKNMRQRVTNLLRQVEELTARNRELESATPGAAGPATAGAGSALDEPARSAPPGVRGKITAVGADGTNAQVNIGSDSGLSPGNLLVVFRGAEYLGDLKITAADPKAAVGRFVPARPKLKVQAGDSVITSFAGSPQ